MDYHLVDTENEAGIDGGIMMPKDGSWPGNMALYIDVDDLAVYRKRVQDAGGKIIVEQMDIPNVGSFCLFADPDGRVNGLWLQNKK